MILIDALEALAESAAGRGDVHVRIKLFAAHEVDAVYAELGVPSVGVGIQPPTTERLAEARVGGPLVRRHATTVVHGMIVHLAGPIEEGAV